MWSVKSEAGQLRAVLVHDASYRSYELNPNLVGRTAEKHVVYENSKKQLNQLYEFCREEGAKVFELGEVINGIVEKASTKEKEEIVKYIWAESKEAPKAEELKGSDITEGYPREPIYDPKADKITLPDSYDYNRFGIYARDPSFGTPLGHIICRMMARINEPKPVKLALTMDPVLKKNVKIVYNMNDDPEAKAFGGLIEGGNDQAVNEEIIGHGLSPRTNMGGFLLYVRNMFAADVDKKLKYICGVQIPQQGSISFPPMHFDTTFNWVDKGKALVLPYCHESEIIKDFPTKKILYKYVDAVRAQAEAHSNMSLLGAMNTNEGYRRTGETKVYGRGKDGKPELIKTEKNWIDFLLKEELLDKDGIIMVGGEPKKKDDVWHFIHAFQEQYRQAPNIVCLKPGLIVAYERNTRTLENLANHGIKVKKLPESFLDEGGGPHCLTCPLDRDAI